MSFIGGYFHLYGFLIGLGVVIGLFVIEYFCRWFDYETKWIEKSFLWVALSSVVGARAYHLATDWQLYEGANLLDLVSIWNGGLGFLGAVLGGLVGLLFWHKFEHKNLDQFFKHLDLVVFGIPIAQSIGRLGNYFNRELYGAVTTLPWGIEISGSKHHPLFLYELLLMLTVWFGLVWLARRRSLVFGKGQYASVYLFSYGLVRFWLEYLRVETARFNNFFGFISIAQWACLLIMILSLVLFWTRRHVPLKTWDFSLE